jgi:predicted esterase
MDKAKLFVLTLTMALYLLVPAFAETVTLTSGTKLEGKLLKRTDEYIEIDFYNSPLRISMDHIAKIDDEIISGVSLGSGITKEPKTIRTSAYILYIPQGIDLSRKYPLVFALSPSADGNTMVNTWKAVADKYKWIVVGSNEHRNGMLFKDMGPILTNTIKIIAANYPVDGSRIIATGFSGGGMSSHYLTMEYPNLIWAIVINTGMITEEYQNGKSYPYPHNKIAVFLASPTDFRYNQMQSDRSFLESIGWKTKWIEFQGGHSIAPEFAYMETAEWIEEQIE